MKTKNGNVSEMMRTTMRYRIEECIEGGLMNFNSLYPEAILDILDVGIYVVDKEGKFVYVNRAYLKHYSITKEEFLSMTTQSLVDDGIIEEAYSDKVFREKQAVSAVQVVNSVSDGILAMLVTFTPIFDDHGEVGFVIVEAQAMEELEERFKEAVLTHHYQKPEMENAGVPLKSRAAKNHERIISASASMQELLKIAERIAKTPTAVLITGESGTGKEVLAKYIFDYSGCKGKLITVNCAAIPENLIESELFGYEKGAFTGADQKGKIGLIEQANNGILFLDEINSLPLSLQGKLLRVLEDHKIRHLGGTKDIHIDFKLVSACNSNLSSMVEQGKFREDLFFRINVVPLSVPPLRERPEDIKELTDYYTGFFCRKYDFNKKLGPNVISFMMQYNWPGNIRELRNYIEYLLVTSMPDVFVINDVPKRITGSFRTYEKKQSRNEKPYVSTSRIFVDESYSLHDYLDQCEKNLLMEVMQKYKTTYRAAEVLGINQSNVVRKLKKYGL